MPARSRIDVPDDWAFVSLGKLTAPIEVKGIAFGGDRGHLRVELSFDDGQTWVTRRFITARQPSGVVTLESAVDARRGG